MTVALTRRATAASLLLAAVVACGVPASAQPPRVQPWRLEYTPGPNAPKNCPDGDYIKAALATKLKGQDPFTDDAPRFISVKLVVTHQRIEAHIEAHNENGEIVAKHVTEADSWRCDQLADRTVFYLREIIDPVVLPAPPVDETPRAPAPAASSPPLPSSPDESPAPAGPHPPRPAVPLLRLSRLPEASRSPWIPKLMLSFGVGPTWWNAPETGISLSAGVGARWGFFVLGLEGRYDHAWRLPTTFRVAASQRGGALTGCFYKDLSGRRVFLKGCVIGDVALVAVDAKGFEFVKNDAPTINIGLRAGVGMWVFGPLGVELSMDGAYVAHRPVCRLDVNEVWRLPPFTGAIRIGLVGLFDLQ